MKSLDPIVVKQMKEGRRAGYRGQPIVAQPCPVAPEGRHHWLLDSKSVGICKWCKEKRQFRKALRGEGEQTLMIVYGERGRISQRER